MRIEEHNEWLTKSTRIIKQKYESNLELLNDAIKKAAAKSVGLTGNSTSFNVEIQRTAVTKFQVIGNEIVALIDIMTNRMGAELIAPGDLAVDDSLANDLTISKTKVNTEIQLALDDVREQLDRFAFDKTKHQAGIEDRVRLAIEDERAPREGAAADPEAIPRTQHVNRITRFKPTDYGYRR